LLHHSNTEHNFECNFKRLDLRNSSLLGRLFISLLEHINLYQKIRICLCSHESATENLCHAIQT